MLPVRATFICAAASAFCFHGVEFSDAFEGLAGDRRRACDGELIEASADMSPAKGELNVSALGERAIAGVAVDLQDTPEAGQMDDRPLCLPVRRMSYAGIWVTTID